MSAVPLLTPPDCTIVTGASGWLGTALMYALTTPGGCWERPGEVRPLVRNRVEAQRLGAIADRVRPVIGELTDAGSMAPLFDRSPAATDVLHTAGVIHPTSVAQFAAVNTDGTRSVVDLAHRHRVRRLVHVSSNSPFGTNAHGTDRFRNDEPYNPYYGYGRSKMDAELAVFDAVERGLNAVIVRPPWFYGPHQPLRQTTFFTMVRTGRFPIISSGDQVRSMVYVDNLVDGVMRAELVDTEPGLGWWIADAEPYTVKEIVATVARALRAEGFEVSDNRVRIPNLVARLAEGVDARLQRSGRYNQQIHVLGEMNKHIACDISQARHQLGYTPRVALLEGMRSSVRWCIERGIEL